MFDIVTYLLRHLAGLKSAVYITNRNKCTTGDAILVPAWENTSSIGIEDRWNDRFVGTLIQRDREIVQRIWEVAQRYVTFRVTAGHRLGAPGGGEAGAWFSACLRLQNLGFKTIQIL